MRDAATAASRRSGPSTRPFVGRRTELRLAHEAVEEAAAGRGGVLLVTGEAGIGKTRLM